MLIRCTKRICEQLKIDPPAAPVTNNPLYSWRLNVVEAGRKQLAVFMHDMSRYCVVLNDIKAEDWPKLPHLFTEQLRDMMLAEKINPNVIDRYLTEAGEITYYKNDDRKMTAWLNRTCEMAKSACLYHDDSIGISLFACRGLVGSKGGKNHWHPSARFYAGLSGYGLPLRRRHDDEPNGEQL